MLSEQEASTVQIDKQKEMNVREKSFNLGKRKGYSRTLLTCEQIAISAWSHRESYVGAKIKVLQLGSARPEELD